MTKEESQGKYLSRCHYYGKLIDIDYVSGALILRFSAYTASAYFGGATSIRIYVPTEIEDALVHELVVNDNYYIIAAPYRVRFNGQYKHRVDMLLNIFREVI